MPRRFEDDERESTRSDYGRFDNAREVNFPSPISLCDVDPFREPELFVNAPWLLPYHWRRTELIAEYIHAGQLPGRVPARALRFAEWDLRFVFPPSAILWQRGENATTARVELVRLLYKRLRRVPDAFPVPEAAGFDTWVYRSYGESLYCSGLSALDVSGWRGIVDVHQDALLYDRPLLRADFRTHRKSFNTEFVSLIKWERLARSRTGFLVPYQMIEIDRVLHAARHERYLGVPEWFAEMECCRGMPVMLPPIVTYLGTKLMNDADSGYWVVFVTSWVAQFASFLLWEAYDQFRVWYVPHRVLEMMRVLDLSFVLGSEFNYRELRKLLAMVDAINWNEVPLSQARRGSRRVDHSPGRESNEGGDFVFFNPYREEFCDEDEARTGSRRQRENPAGYASGYVYTESPEVESLVRVLKEAEGAQHARALPSSAYAGARRRQEQIRAARVVLEAFGQPVNDATLAMVRDRIVTNMTSDAEPKTGTNDAEMQETNDGAEENEDGDAEVGQTEEGEVTEDVA